MSELNPRKENPITTWTNEDLKRYLLSLNESAEDHYSCLEIGLFPDEILLSQSWHDTFSDLIIGTVSDGFERMTSILPDYAGKKIVLAPIYVLTPESSKTPIIENYPFWGLLESNRQRGLVGPVGTIVTRPRDLTGRWGSERDDFNSDQLLDMLQPVSIMELMGLVTGQIDPAMTGDNPPPFLQINVGPTGYTAAFRTKESTLLTVSEDAKLLRSGVAGISSKDRTVEIAKIHKLAIYKGKPGRELKRIYP